MNANSFPEADVGVIVGRFQVDELHEAHTNLIQTVVDNHDKVLIFLGLSATKCSVYNPLDFEARKQMILEKFPDVNVLYIKDVPSDEDWSKKLDDTIDDIKGPNQCVILYGGRDAFINCYKGKYPTYELQQKVFVSGKDIRKTISNKVKASSDFRKGVIWATMNQYPKVFSTVDVAIFNDDYSQILLARKPNETLYRLVGGFVNPGDTYEQTARREVMEETKLEITDPVYVTSAVIDDWRYRQEKDKITTSLFVAKKMYGCPEPNDDICELKWFDTNEIKLDDSSFLEMNIVEEHRYLVKKALNCQEVVVSKAFANKSKGE